MLSRPRPSTLLLAAAMALLLSWLWSAWRPASFAVEVTLASSVSATSQVFFDRGQGFNEADSFRISVPGGNLSVRCRFPLPEGTYRALRFDPIDRNGSVTFSALCLVTPGGAIVRRVAPDELHPNAQIAESIIKDDRVSMSTVAGANDPYYTIPLAQPLTLAHRSLQRWLWAAGRFAAVFLGLLCFAVLGARGQRYYAAAMAAGWRRTRAYPHIFLVVTAAAAAVLASYPVVFCGRSYISPNNGIVLLYAAVPTVPGLTDWRQANVHGADVGAMMWQHLPGTVVEHRALFRDGELPLWNRYNSCGVPLLGQGQSMFGDPLHVPVLLAGGAAWAFDLKFVLARALFAAGLGFTVWAAVRHLPAAALVTFAAAFAGFFNYRLNHPAIFSVGVAPWVLLCWVRVAQAATLRESAGWCAGLLLANFSLLTSGTVKEAYMLLLALNLAGGLALLLSSDAPVLKWRKGMLAAAAGLILILVSAPVWLTFLDTLAVASTSSDQPQAWQLPFNRLIGLFDDLFYRELSSEHVVVAPSLNFLLLLGVLWFCARLPRFRRDSLALILAAGALAAISLVFAWVPGSLIVRLPVLRNVIHIANTFSCVAMIFLAVLAGYGFRAARDALAVNKWWRPALVTLLLLGGLFLAYFHGMAYYWSGRDAFRQWLLIVPVHRFFFEYLALMLAAMVTLTLVAAWYLRRRQLPALAGFAALLALGVLLGRNGSHYSTTYQEVYFTAPAIRADLQAPSAAVEFMKTSARGQPFRAIGTANTLFPGFTGVYGLEGINGPDAVMNRAYVELMEACGLLRSNEWRMVLPPAMLAQIQPMLDLLNVRFCAIEPGAAPPGGTYTRVADLDLSIYASPTVWPRAFFTDTVIAIREPKELVALANRADGRPFAAMAAPDLTALATLDRLPRDYEQRLVVPATDYRLTNNTTSFTIHAPQAGVIVLHESYFPGDFRVTMNGKPVDDFRVNHAFKGIVVEAPGLYRVTFAYRPRHWTLALTLAGLGLALVAAGIAGFGMIEKRSGLPVPTGA
jgi:hypothetical protein